MNGLPIRAYGIEYFVVKRSKWTVEAWLGDVKYASAPSRSKLKTKLLAMGPPYGKHVEPCYGAPSLYERSEVKKIRIRPATIKSTVIELVPTGLNDREIIAIVRKKFPQYLFTRDHMRVLRASLVQENIVSPQFATRGSKHYRDWKLEHARKYLFKNKSDVQ